VPKTLRRFQIDRLGFGQARVKVMRNVVGEVAAHWHDYYEFVYVLEGAALHRCNGVVEIVSPGHAALLGPTDIHAYSPHGRTPMICYNLAIDPVLAEHSLSGLLGLHEPTGLWSVSDLAQARRWLDQLAEESRSSALGSTRLVEALLDCVLISFARGLPSSQITPPTPDSMVAAVFFIEQHFRELLTLDTVASQVHLSPHHFSERFSRHTGTPFQTYLQHRRLHFARALLLSTGLGIGQVAVASGFGDADHFSRAYRRRYDRPPSVDCRHHDSATPRELNS
jgi:AraC-like DNA-binding protein/mannose-6-phosphate isomerase-like protein (cupin superfamily)